MKNNIVIIDYGMGNVNSVKKQLTKAGASVIISSDPNEIINADKIVLPGVGHFKKAMENLSELNLIELLNDLVLTKGKPILGICLGMQLMTKFSEEGNVSGLGWFDAQVIRMHVSDPLRFKIPHVGWNSVTTNKPCALTQNIENNSLFYFVHAYKVVANSQNDVVHTTTYDQEFVSAISKDNIFGVQYHPEKSQEIGIQLFKNFIAI